MVLFMKLQYVFRRILIEKHSDFISKIFKGPILCFI